MISNVDHNFLRNPLFYFGTTGWTPQGTSDFQVVNGIAQFTPAGQWGRIDNERFTTKANHIYYCRGKVKSSDPNVSCGVIYNANYGITTGNTNPGQWCIMSQTFATSSDFANNAVGIISTSTSGFSLVQVEWAFCIDLTEIFGAGKEPSKEYCDACIALMNKVPNPSFEMGDFWWCGGTSFTTEQVKFGAQSMKISTGDVVYYAEQVNWKPIANHKYYGRIYNKGTMNLNRYEINAGDSADTMIIMIGGSFSHADWTAISGIASIPSVNPNPPWGPFQIRAVYTSSVSAFYNDGLMIIDLTEAFGAGNEPSKAWCDANISYFTNVAFIAYTPGGMQMIPSLTPATVNIGQQFVAAVQIANTEPTIAQSMGPYSGTLYSGDSYSFSNWTEPYIF